MAEERTRKRRDSLQDQLGAPVYTGDPVPPFTAIMKDLVYISYRADPDQAQALLPPGLTPVPGATITLAFFRLGPGWGISDTTAGFFAIAVNELAAPDTSEAAWFAEAVMEDPACALAARHYGPFRPGGSEVIIAPDGLIQARMWADDGGELVRATLRISGPLQPQAANDRYIGRTSDGRIVAAFTTVTGPDRACEFLSLDIARTASSAVQALRPTELLFGILDPELLFCWSVAEPVDDLLIPRANRIGRTALLDLLDRQARACAILSGDGRVLHANAEARQLLARLPIGQGEVLRVDTAAGQTRFRAALAACAEGRLDPKAGRFLMTCQPGDGPLVLHLSPSDPALAGPGTVLALIADPSAQARLADPGLLQLLGLTPAEARIAAAVGAGLPPREAAATLDLAESTVRSSLKVIFDKLGLRRQADLVRLAARLGGG